MPPHQVFLYLDNVHGYSSYRPFAVYNGTTLSGLWDFVVETIPQLAGATYTCFRTAAHRTQCDPVFSAGQTEAHFVIKAKAENNGPL